MHRCERCREVQRGAERYGRCGQPFTSHARNETARLIAAPSAVVSSSTTVSAYLVECERGKSEHLIGRVIRIGVRLRLRRRLRLRLRGWGLGLAWRRQRTRRRSAPRRAGVAALADTAPRRAPLQGKAHLPLPPPSRLAPHRPSLPRLAASLPRLAAAAAVVPTTEEAGVHTTEGSTTVRTSRGWPNKAGRRTGCHSRGRRSHR